MTRGDLLHRLSFNRSFLWLLVAIPLLFVATGLWALPIAAWLAPLFLLRFVRDQPLGRGGATAALTLGVISCVTWYGATGHFLAEPQSYLVGAALGIVASAPYLIDRLLSSRLSGVAATLVFPTAVVAVEYAASFGPFGTWSSAAYTQQNLAFLQLTSITGLWGVSFLLHWTAGVANAVWEDGLDASSTRGAVGLWAGVLMAVFVFGSARLAWDTDTTSNTVPVATVTGLHDASSFWDVRRHAESRSAVRDSARAVQRDYLRRARRAARAGARLISWPEAAVPVPRKGRTAFLNRARALADTHDVYLAMGVSVFPGPESDAQLQNTVIWTGPAGRTRAEELKTHLVPGEPGRAGTGTLPNVSTTMGRWTSAVCYDLDFPTLIRQAGRNDVDLLVAPSNDWAAIAERHAHMARIRAIENGTTLLRPTSNGLSLATGPLGRTRARTNHFTTQAHLQMAHLSTDGKSTIYAVVGDVFAWGCGLGLLLLSGRACLHPPRSLLTEFAPSTSS